jgi:hypothetical protein
MTGIEFELHEAQLKLNQAKLTNDYYWVLTHVRRTISSCALVAEMDALCE